MKSVKGGLNFRSPLERGNLPDESATPISIRTAVVSGQPSLVGMAIVWSLDHSSCVYLIGWQNYAQMSTNTKYVVRGRCIIDACANTVFTQVEHINIIL